MAEQYTIYTTNAGERWDQIAYKAYGDAKKIKPIIDANPGVLVQDKLPAGLKIIIPIIQATEAVTTVEQLPPWKR